MDIKIISSLSRVKDYKSDKDVIFKNRDWLLSGYNFYWEWNIDNDGNIVLLRN